ncbi:uncharacterized protein ATNIH1004_007135 [Aspergillus tanneri]|uniref:Uncharacterized protein n=1 Tax=Aspergillus tanneri TaxID=1220188 RepID=A0A5M9MIN0_9EURO|nr:uncharacterized protein ATNIH1004_007135 [Aspergillus tanneri]KAA8645716.1 hypothetical protein ATNIH1004_007135 [Aspergillus tanneri]
MDPTLPISHNGFEYYNNELYVVIPPYHRHRRFGIPELQAFFNTSSIEEQPAHWYRAQLIHYGLQPITNKRTAAMRFLEALNRDILEIPEYIRRLERELKESKDRQKKSKGKNSLKYSCKRKALTLKPFR